MDPDFSDSQDDRTQSVIKPGVEIGHYRVESYLGQGGMGQVYLARELRLDKKVAIKFLSSALNQDESFRTRFISEAKALALVNHPNVVQVFELSEYESQPFYSMEYVDGSSLPEYLKQNDPGTIELLDIAVQVTEGLTEVHEAGIIHRDIKPSNILLDKKGRAKLSDFGLAISPGAQRVTKSRAIVGTFSFMSPEQLEGKPLDHRSDIFSLGVTLYEMFSGRHPFAKESDVATMNAIANSVVDPISKVFKNTPLGLQLILDKALKKNPDDRYQNADELADDLKTLQSEMRTSTGSVTSHFINAFATRANRYKTTVVAVTFILLAAISWIIYKISSDKETELSSPVQKRLTYFNNAYWGAVSPNGHYFAYSLFDEFKGASVWVRDIDAEDPIEVFTADSVYDINWSPDSRELLFAGIKDSLSGIFLVPALGGQFRLYPHHLTELPSVTWSPDGNRFAINAATDSPRNIFIYEKKSGSSSTIQLGEDFELARSINWSPTGNKFLITSLSPNALWTMSLDGASVTLLQDETTFSPTWNNSGDAIYFLKVENDNQFLKKLKIDVKTGAPIGEPQILFTGIGSSLAAELSITSDGTKLVCTKEHRWNDLLMVSLDKANNPNIQPLKLSELATQHSWPVFSPDQKSIAYQAILSNGEAHLFVVSTDGRNRKRLTFDNFINFSPAWSPDGNRLAYGIALSRGDNYKVAIMNLDGGTPKVFENTLVSENLPKIIWWPGRKIIYQKRGNHNLGIIDPNTGTESLLFKNETDALISSPEYSSDGSRIVALYDPTPQLPPENQADSSGYWLFSVENNVEPVYLGKYDGNPIGWSSDDNWIYTLSGRSVCRINSINGTLDTVATLNMEYLWKRASITPDGNKLACLNWVFITDVWMIENFDPEI